MRYIYGYNYVKSNPIKTFVTVSEASRDSLIRMLDQSPPPSGFHPVGPPKQMQIIITRHDEEQPQTVVMTTRQQPKQPR